MNGKSNSEERHERIETEIKKNPFISDEDLATLLQVSIHTVRSDRRRMGIPEVRKRGKDITHNLFAQSRALSNQEVIGEILEIESDKEGLSLLETTEAMSLEKTKIVRGHILFAQANTIANAVVDAKIALTAEAKIEYIAPAYAGDRILAKAKVVGSHKRKRVVEVVLKTQKDLVLHGTFTITCLTYEAAAHLRIIHEKESGEK
ncbi:transcription factor FapR [candidate division FCPU426 bacterium]|nr:transcription factor FapR [candidate division FCPU426 bacterium]